jgi:hypothetical protein
MITSLKQLGVMSTMMIPLSFFWAIWTGVAEDLPIILKLTLDLYVVGTWQNAWKNIYIASGSIDLNKIICWI